MNFCTKCGKKLNVNKKCDDCDKKKITLKDILLWIFFLPIMICLYVWKSDKIEFKNKRIIIIGVIFFYIVLAICLSSSENTIKEENIKKCYNSQTYKEITKLFDIKNLKGNFEDNIKCENLKIRTSENKEITIEEKENKLIGISVKDGNKLKYVYWQDNSKDIYDSITLKLKKEADEKLKKQNEESELNEKTKKSENKKIKIFTDIGLSLENAKEAYNIITDCGLSNISKLKKYNETENIISYTTTYTSGDNNQYNIIIFIADNKIYAINSGNLKIYNREENIKININDYILSSSEMSNLKLIAEEYVKNNLKAPSTAKFPGSFFSPFEGWEMQQSGTTYSVKSYVDSQNSFGAMVRTQFYMELQFDSNGNLSITKFQTS